MTRDEICSKFLDALPYAPYAYQEEALMAWFGGDSDGVMVCAPTGMGKTLLAEAAVFEALHTGKKLYYTSPLIALTEQKFRELQDLAEKWGFARDSIGMLTGNRKINPGAPVRVVVAEILLNHLVAHEDDVTDFAHTQAVVMDEFHNFNDPERGIVWEMTLALLPRNVRVLLLSATVGNPFEFADWLKAQHGRRLDVVLSQERRVPLEFVWVENKYLSELLAEMVSPDDSANRTPALVFCFRRDDCWEVAEQIKGLPLISATQKAAIDKFLWERAEDLAHGAGPKLRQMLLRGVGVHHAGVLPRHKDIVETLFNRRLAPFVICTETLAAGVNLPARSVVLSTLIKGKRGEKQVVPPSTAHQIFGRAGRPQFDTRGFVYAVAHEDDARIAKWREKYDKIDPNSRDPGIMRMRKELERKRPTRRKTEQYWVEGDFKRLIAAGPAKLGSRAMIPYRVLIYMLCKTGTLRDARAFLGKRFAPPGLIEKFGRQLDCMVENLEKLGYLTRGADGEPTSVSDTLARLLNFRSLEPLFAEFLSRQLVRANYTEKVLALEAALEVPPTLERFVRIPPDLPPGPLQKEVLEPMMTAMGVSLGQSADDEEPEFADDWTDDEEEEQVRPPTFPEMLKLAFEAQLAHPDPVFIQPKWMAGAAFDRDCDFWKFVRVAELIKQEGLVLRHLLRLVIVAREFLTHTEDPDYATIGDQATRVCRSVDPSYTDRFLAEVAEQPGA